MDRDPLAVSNVYATDVPGGTSTSGDPHACPAPVTRWLKEGPLKNRTVLPTGTAVMVGAKAHGRSLISVSVPDVSAGVSVVVEAGIAGRGRRDDQEPEGEHAREGDGADAWRETSEHDEDLPGDGVWLSSSLHRRPRAGSRLAP